MFFKLMRILLAIICCLTLLSACSTPSDERVQQAGFITLLGADTLAAEHVVVSDNTIEATVMLRTPSTSLRRYTMNVNEAGGIERLETIVTTFTDGEQPASRSVLVSSDSGYTLTSYEGGEETSRTLAAPVTALPFLDMIHWPFDQVLPRAYSSAQDVYEQPLLSGRRAQTFEIRRLSADSMTIKHPFRGTMGVTVDDVGQIMVLDAGNTTRKLRVRRVESVDVEALAAYFSELDKTGSAFGPLSGRGETLATVNEANIRIDFGTPSKRGRTIFGNIVPWGEVWRTGANRATHFETDQDLTIGDVSVPAGTYTLFTIPESEGGTLIINTQTDQGGTTYNSELDLGRVSMTRTQLDDVVEVFNISIEEEASSHRLQIAWDQSAFSVPVQIN